MLHQVEEVLGRSGKGEGPMAELEYWQSQAEDLVSLEEQLNHPTALAMGRLLHRDG